jgi:hypothetical protein
VKLPRAEQETILRLGALDAEWNVYTDSPKMQRLLARKGWGKGAKYGDHGLTYTMPAVSVTIRSKKAVDNPPRGGTFQNWYVPKLRRKGQWWGNLGPKNPP